ncbi:hypothetical protein [Phormidesmis priestleyi]
MKPKPKPKPSESDQPAKNLFVLVNFMDLLRKEQDRQQVQQLVENFVCGDTALIAGKNRLHFISAQAALDAMLTGDKNEYVKSLQQFMCSLVKWTRRVGQKIDSE